MKKKVLVAMSGGVDSSVAAALLKKKGFEVIGLTMCFGLSDSKTKRPICCSTEAIQNARRLAHRLGIRHYVLNFSRSLEEKVIKEFCREYLKGRTPNPCVRCNQYIKFDELFKKARALGCSYLATGHYSRIVNSDKEYLLKKAKDSKKDQSYFLYRIKKDQLKHLLFPLGGLKKQKVRSIARDLGFINAHRPGSQEVCFIPDDDYKQFIASRFTAKIREGDIVDQQGNVLGRHKGIAFYTIGQRKGLRIARGHPLYITKIDAKKNRVIVGKNKDLLKRDFIVKDTHFLSKPFNKKVVLGVKIRYNHKQARAEIRPLDRRRCKVKFFNSQRAITPGQSAVFYDRDLVLGGGIIDRILD